MLSLRPTRRFCHSSSSAVAVAAAAAAATETPRNRVQSTKPLEPPALDKLKAERNPEKLFHLFKANANNRLLIENRFAFDDTVSRLAGARRFDYIEELLEQQKRLPQGRREGFIVRIIILYGKAGMTKHAINTFYDMNSFGCRRTVKSFNSALSVLALTRNFDSIVDFLALVPLRFDIQLDTFSINIAIKAFCEMGKLQEAYLFLLEAENKGIQPDVVTYTTLMSAFYQNKRWEIGNGLWNRMVLKGCMPNLATFNVRIQFLVTVRRAWDANALLGLMQRVGVEPDEVTFNLVIKGFFQAGYIDMAKRVYSALHGKGYKPNAKIYQTMIHYMCKSGDFDLAYTMSKDSMQKNWFPSVDTIYMLLECLKGNGQIDKGRMILTLAKRRKPPFSANHLAAMQSILSKSFVKQGGDASMYLSRSLLIRTLRLSGGFLSTLHDVCTWLNENLETLPSNHSSLPNPMSKSILSRIKPRHRLKATAFTPPGIKNLVLDVIRILKTQQQWQDSLESRFAESEVVVSDVAHFVIDRIHDAELGLKFFDWASTRPFSCSLDGFAYSSLLKLLARFRVFSEIELVLENMKVQDLKPTHEALSTVIRAYGESGLVDRALQLFHTVREMHNCFPTVVASNSLLNGLVKNRKVDIARQLYDEMLETDDGVGAVVDNYSTSIVVKGLCKLGKVEEGRRLIEDRWGKGCVPHVVFYNTIIDGFCKKGDLQGATRVLKELKLKGVLPTLETYGVLINGFCKAGEFEEVDQLLIEMTARGLNLNVQVFNNIIDAYYKHGLVTKAVETMRRMVDMGCEPDIATYNTLINFSCRGGKIEEAEELIERAMERRLLPNKFTYTPVMHAYCKQGDYVKASNMLFKIAETGDKPDLVSYGAFIHGTVVVGEIEVALMVREKMMEKGVFPDAQIYNVLMSGLCKKGRFPAAKLLLSEMLDRNVQPDAYVYATLVDGFIRNDELDEAKKLFEVIIGKGIDPGTVGYNAMIKGFCKFGKMTDAMSCFNKMKNVHHAPDEYTYSTVIDGYVKQHDLNSALKMFGQMVKQKFKPNVVAYTSLINGFCKKADMSSAEKVFRGMQSFNLEPNVVTYTILIGGFFNDGKPEKAASFFELMLMNNYLPNDATFHNLIKGLTNITTSPVLTEKNESKENDRSLILDFFAMMISDGFNRVIAAYNSVIVCLCKHGMVDTAQLLQTKMLSKGFGMDSVCFTALLHGLCQKGKSKEWRNIISCDLNKIELQTAVEYSLTLDKYLYKGRLSEASLILQTLIEDSKFSDQPVEDLKVIVR
ncbi:pentatricopeptide repeat-containing protein At1g52620 [Gastrolobium bilobum]|uniref:pentatricopeptide repeat-containing protein At1g52620 n=1 Tax=Gastrolobium bilobum TaxID=150636 RepID=UPI002AB0C1A4|nr:pentatricopeptide repeat-containing protein At1g52620 [Gastrolobium bilobum]